MVREATMVEVDPETRVQKIFMKSIELLGGLKQLTRYRSLTWLPALARAAYAVVLKEEYNRVEDEIAKELGITRQSVRNILQANPEYAKERIKRLQELVDEEGGELKGHTAGAIVKLAYKLLNED